LRLGNEPYSSSSLKSHLMKLFQLTVAILLYAIGAAFIAPACFGQNDEARLRQAAEQILKEQGNSLSFRENKGQWDQSILFQASGPAGLFRVLKDGISIVTYDLSEDTYSSTEAEPTGFHNEARKGIVWYYHFDQMHPDCRIKAHQPKPDQGVSHFYSGEQSVTNAMAYEEIRYQGIYENIDLRLYSDDSGRIRYDYIVYPGGDPSAIAFNIEGADVQGVDEEGKLNILIGEQPVRIPAPYAYQINDEEEEALPYHFSTEENQVGFALSGDIRHDPTRILIIDPLLLEWSTYFGNTTYFQAYESYWWNMLSGLRQRDDSSFVVAGSTNIHHFNWPVSPGAYQPLFNQSGVILACFHTRGTLLWSTHLGSTCRLLTFNILSDGTTVIGGTTADDNFPVLNAAQDSLAGNYDFFVTRFGYQGQLLWSTYWGGSSYEALGPTKGETTADIFNSMVLSDQSILFMGETQSTDIHTTPNAVIPALPAQVSADGMIFRFSKDGDCLYSSYIPARPTAFIAFADSIALIRFGWVSSGWTPYLLSNPNGWTPSGGSSSMQYLMCVDLKGSANWGSWIGGSSQIRNARMTALDDTSFLFAGHTMADDYPVTPNAFQSHRAGSNDLVFSRIHTNGRMIWSTYFGGPQSEAFNYYTEFQKVGDKVPFFISVGINSSQNLPLIPGGIALNNNSSWYYGTIDTDGQIKGTYNNIRGNIIGSGFRDSVYYALNHYTAQNHLFTNIPSDHSVLSLIKMDVHGHIFENKPLSYFPGNYSWEERASSILPLASGDLLIRTQLRLANTAIPPPLTNASWDALMWKFPGNSQQRNASIIQITDQDCNLKYNSYLAKGNYYRFYIFREVVETDSLLIIGGTTDDVYVPPISPGAIQTANLANYSGLFLTALRHKHLPFLDSIGPQTQEVCILSNDIRPIGGASRIITKYLENGMPKQTIQTPKFVWEYSTDSILWTVIHGYQDSVYHPQPVLQTTWYRRKAMDTDSSIMSISNTVRLNVRPHFAPSATAGFNAYLCPGSSYTLGGTPSASGGTPPYTYAWTPGLGLDDPAAANPEIQNAQQAAQYRLRVTDAAGCTMISELQITVLRAHLGEDQFICEGIQSLLTAPGYPGATNVTYLWESISGSGSSSISDTTAQYVLVSPDQTTEYVVHISDGGLGSGGQCPSDTVLIEVTPAPIADAGSDHELCYGEDADLGSPGVSGYNYYWTPGRDLDDMLSPTPHFNGTFPDGGIRKYVLSVIHESARCFTAYDTVEIRMSFADAGVDACSPRWLGGADLSEGLAAYHWEVISGDTSSILGKENYANPFVNSSIPTTYALEVSLNGVSCYDTVVVDTCYCPVPYGTIKIPVRCSDYSQDLPFHLANINADGYNYEYEWTGPHTHILDNPYTAFPTVIHPISGPTSFTVIARHKQDTNVMCSGTVMLMTSFGTPPQALVRENQVICPEVTSSVHIGAPPIAGLIYDWTPDASLNSPLVSDPLASPPLSQQYKLVVTDTVTGCADSNQMTVNVRRPIANAGPDGYFCGSSTFLIGSNPSAHMTYLWSPTTWVSDSTASQQYFTVYSANVSLYLTVTDTITGCTDKDTVHFFSYDGLIADAGQDTSICRGSTVKIGMPDTIDGLVYAWYPQIWLDDPTASNPEARPMQSITYFLMVSGNSYQGCDAIDSVHIDVFGGSMTVDAGPDQSICAGQDIPLSVTPQPGYVYSWEPEQYLDEADQPTAWVQDLYQTKIFSLTVFDTINCLIGTDQLTVFVQDIPECYDDWEFRPLEYVICEGDSIQIGCPHFSGAVYLWQPGIGLSDSTIAQPKVSVSSDTSYTLYMLACGDNYEYDVFIRVDSLPVANAGPDTSFCFDFFGSGVEIGEDRDTDGLGFLWTPSTGLSENDIPNPTANPSVATEYVLTVFNSCGLARDTVLVEPVINQASGGSFEICPGESVTLGVPLQAGLSYLWDSLPGIPAYAGNTITLNPTSSFSSTLHIIDTVSMCYTEADFSVSIKTLSPFSFELPNVVCEGGCNDISFAEVNPQNFFNISWSPITGISNPGILEPTICADSNQTYYVGATDIQSGCPVQDTITILVNPFHTPEADAGPDTILCLGQSLILGGGGPDSLLYAWSPQGGLNPGYTAKQPLVSPSQTTTYTLTVMDPVSGCFGTDAVNVQVVDLNVDLGNNHDICLTSTVQLQPSVSGGTNYSYQWSPATGLDNPGIAQPIASPPASIAYTLTITDLVSGCTAADQVSISVNPVVPPNVQLGQNLVLCSGANGGSVNIGVPAQQGMLYQWNPTAYLSDPYSSDPYISTHSTFGSTHPSSRGNMYILSITDTSKPSGCGIARDTIYIKVMNLEVSFEDDYEICSGEPVTLEPDGISDYPMNFSWSPVYGLSDPNTLNPTASPGTSTTYQLNVSLKPYFTGDRVLGCATSGSVQVNVTPNPVAFIPPKDLGCNTKDMQLRKLNFPAFSSNRYRWEPAYLVSNPDVANPYFVGDSSATLYLNVSPASACLPDETRCNMLKRNPVSYFRLGENAGSIAHSEVGGFTGTYYGSTNPASGLVPGDPDLARSFTSSSSSYLELPANATNTISGDYTISFVVRAPSYSNSYLSILRPAGGAYGITVFHYRGSIRIYNWSNNSYSGYSSNRLRDGQPHHIVIQPYGSSNRVYIDGNYYTQFTGSVNFSPGAFLVGSQLDGVIDELAFFDYTVPVDELYDIMEGYIEVDVCDTTIAVPIKVGDSIPPILFCQDTIIACTEDSSPANTGYPLVIDNCDDNPSLYYSDSISHITICPELYHIFRTWVAVDTTGNMDSCLQLITVIDTLGPDLVCPQDLILDCLADTSVGATGMPQATDLCSPAVHISYTDLVIPGCGLTYTVERTFTATDECGNTSYCTQTITLQDTTPPAILCPKDVVLDCPADTTPSNTGFALANDICGNVTISYSDAVTPGCGNTFTLQRTWTATDECGLTSSCTQIITVQDTSPPSISCPPDVILDCPADTAPSNTGFASGGDACGSLDISYSDDVTPGCGNTFTLLRIWTATDQCGLSASCTQTIIVQDTNPPTIICPPDTLIDCTADTTPANTGYATGGDACANVSIYYADDLTPGCGNTYTLHRTWTVTDECGLSASCVQTITIQDTTPPVITCPACVELQFPADTSVATNGYATAIEECGNVIITYSDSVIPITNYTFNVYRTWKAEDECGNVSTCLQTLGVLDTLPPVISCPPDTIIDCPADTSVANLGVATAVDAPGSLILIAHTDALIPGCGNSFTIERSWIATDGCGNTALCIQQILVQDTTAPLIFCPPDVVLNCPADTSVMANGLATASDECAGYSISYSDVVTYGCGNSFGVARTWRATDDCGNFTECAQTLTVQDTTPPLITCPPDLTTIADFGSCDDFVAPNQPQAWDECSDWSYVNDFTGTVDASAIYPAGTTLVTWTLTDDCGNASSCIQTILVKNFPLAHDDDTIVPTGAIVAFDVLQNDFDCLGRIDPECVSILTQPLNGTLSIDPLSGIITYTPNVPTLNYTDTYQYIMCNDFGLQDTATVTITYMKPPKATLMGGGVICKYNSSYLVVHLTGQSPWSFALYDGYTTTVYAGLTQSIWTKNVSPVSSRDYTILWVQDATSLKVPGTGSATVTIASPAQFTITGGGTYNQGDPGKIIGLNGSQTGVEYQLFVNTAPVGAPLMGTGAPISFGYQTTPGFYTVRATDVTAFCSEYMLGSAQISMNPAPATCTVSGGGICCMGCYDLDIELDCSESGIRYELYRDGQATGRVKYGNGDTLVWEDLNMEGTYTVKATNPSTGANVLMDGFATVEFFLIPVAILSGSTTIIEGQQAMLEVSLTGTPPFRFGLSDGTSETLFDNVMGYSMHIPVSPTDTTTYTITWVTDSAGCGDIGYGLALVNVIPLKFGSIGGTVQYQSSQPFPLAGVDLSLKDDQGNTLAQTTSGADGGYLFSSIPPGNYTLLPAFNDIPGGINATDALLSMQHFTGLTSLGPIALKAADVNASGMVNATDAYGIALHFVNPAYTFPSGRWAFIAPDVIIPVDGSSQIAHIQALCYGDVNASFDPLKTFFVQDLKQEGEIIATSEEAIKIPVFAERSARVAALSIRMDYPVELLAVKDVILAGESDKDLLVNIQNGSIRVSWFDLEPIQIEQQKPILYLLAAPLKEAWNQDHSLTLRVSSESQLADINAEPIAMEYSIPKLTLLSAEPSLRVVPNPFTTATAVKFTLPLDGRVSLELFNALGQKSQTLVDAFKVAGSHQFSLDSRNLAPGVYMLRLTQETEKGMVQQSLRIIKE